MGIRTKETSEYFPKVKKSAAAQEQGTSSNSSKDKSAELNCPIASGSTTTTTKVIVEEDKQINDKTVGTSSKNKSKAKPKIPAAKSNNTKSKVANNGKAKCPSKKKINNKKDEDDDVSTLTVVGVVEEISSGSSATVTNGVAEIGAVSTPKGAANKLKNGIIKANSKMKKGMRIMMERTNKILERSKNCKKQTKKGAVVKPRIPPARCSARLGRKNSGEGKDKNGVNGGKVCEEPLRTVELIKRPLTLRDPATKLLYLASLGLYPTSDPDSESDSIPIVIISQEIISPGGKKGKLRSMELPLMPNWGNRYTHNESNHQPNTNNRGNGGDLLLQIASVSPRSQESAQTPARPVKTAKRKSQSQSPPLPNENDGILAPTVSTTPIFVSESVTISNAAQQNLSITIPKVEVQTPQIQNALNNTSEITIANKTTAKVQKKRKTVDAIIKEMEIRNAKPNNIMTPVNAKIEIKSEEIKPPCLLESYEFQMSSSATTTTTSSNPILEGLMKNPVKKRVPKRKQAAESNSPIQITPFNNIQAQNTINFNQISMTVPLQPAPGLPMNMNLGMAIKESSKSLRGKKLGFELPNPVPIPIPPGFLSYASLLPNGDLKTADKPKKQRKPRVKKPKEEQVQLSLPNNCLSSTSPVNTLTPAQYPSIPYLPPHLEAFFKTPPMLNVPQPVSQSHTEEALDLCVKASRNPPTQSKPKKYKDLSKSLLKPMVSGPVQDDGPLNLVMIRPEMNGSVQSIMNKEKNNLPVMDMPSPSPTKQPGSLDSVKQMLGRLHTRIAPAVNGVQLITIE